MPANLASIEARVRQFLSDVNATAYSIGQIDEGIRQALAEYSNVRPRQLDTYVVLPAAGREIALNALDDLTAVLEVWWPFDSTTEQWPPNRVQGFRLDFDDGQPLLTLTTDIADQPQPNDELRLWYTTGQHLDGLDGVAGTSLIAAHESTLVIGAAGFAAMIRAGDVTSTYAQSAKTQSNLEDWAAQRIGEFRGKLAQISAQSIVHGPAFARGWGLDEWENQGVIYPTAGQRPSPPH